MVTSIARTEGVGRLAASVCVGRAATGASVRRGGSKRKAKLAFGHDAEKDPVLGQSAWEAVERNAR